MKPLFATLAEAGIARDDLYLAWDFTVASERNLSERMLHIRDDAFAQLGDTNLADLKVAGRHRRTFRRRPIDAAPDRHARRRRRPPVTATQDARPADRAARRGPRARPLLPDQPGCPPGSRFVYPPATACRYAIPGNTMAAKFICNVPRRRRAATRPAPVALRPRPARAARAGERRRNVKALAHEHGFMFCATDWSGMSQEDLPNARTILADLSRFRRSPTAASRGSSTSCTSGAR